jgi:hypothetical protein
MKALAIAVAGGLVLAGTTPSRNNTEIIDAAAFLFFDLEEGKARYEIGPPAARQVLAGGAVQYTLVERSSAYGSTEEKNKDINGSLYVREVYHIISPSHCVVSADSTIEFSKGTSRTDFGVRPSFETIQFDLTKFSTLDANPGRDRWVEVNISGTGVLCIRDADGEKCRNDHMSVAQAPDAGTVDRVVSRKRRAIEFLKARGCTGRPY